MSTHFIGIDLSTTPESIGCCVLTALENGKLELTDSPITVRFNGSEEKVQNGIIDFVRNKSLDPDTSVIVAIDVPFGWPVHFSEAVNAHTVGKAFGDGTEFSRDRYRYRLTDRFLRDTLHRDSGVRSKLNPLSVSTDRLGLTAMFGSEIISRMIAELGFRVDVSDGPRQEAVNRVLIEVYPKASLLSWEPIIWTANRNQPAERKFHEYCSAILRRCNPLFDVFPVMPSEFLSMHHLDAFICALTARSYLLGACYTPGDADYLRTETEILQREGWIWVPRVVDTQFRN